MTREPARIGRETEPKEKKRRWVQARMYGRTCACGFIASHGAKRHPHTLFGVNDLQEVSECIQIVHRARRCNSLHR